MYRGRACDAQRVSDLSARLCTSSRRTASNLEGKEGDVVRRCYHPCGCVNYLMHGRGGKFMGIQSVEDFEGAVRFRVLTMHRNFHTNCSTSTEDTPQDHDNTCSPRRLHYVLLSVTRCNRCRSSQRRRAVQGAPDASKRFQHVSAQSRALRTTSIKSSCCARFRRRNLRIPKLFPTRLFTVRLLRPGTCFIICILFPFRQIEAQLH